MKILSVTAQKPDSTGSGIYLTELVRGFKKKGITQSVIAGVTKADQVCLPEGVPERIWRGTEKSSGGVGSGRDPVSPSVSPYSDCKRAVS